MKKYEYYYHDGAFFRRIDDGGSGGIREVLFPKGWAPYEGDTMEPVTFGNRLKGDAFAFGGKATSGPSGALVIGKMAQAYNFAAVRHAHQRRKGEAAEPYMNHLTEVAELVARAAPDQSPHVVLAAVLHDTVEDTETTLVDIADNFGIVVAELVAEVTDDKSLPKVERKRLQIEHAAHASVGAKIIKLADKTSNLRSLASSPPAEWSDQRRMEYASWARQVVGACRGANASLEAQFDAAYAALDLNRD